jgi:hypothetical protein
MEAAIAQLKTVKPVVSAPRQPTARNYPSENDLEGDSREMAVQSIYRSR